MAAATGHRICNDCMKSCIYQKQEPVDIPQAETRTLKDVLELPWGFEIYSLLTRWNPLNLRRPLPQAADRQARAGRRHGAGRLHARASPDERRPHGRRHRRPQDRAARRRRCRASTRDGERVPFEPIRDVATLHEPLDERVMAGFGGVAEYGITVRWDKNFLKIVRLLLERRAQFALFGGVRFGGTLDRRGRVRARLRSRRARGRRGPADGARHAERPRARRAHGVRLPDGAAAHRRGEDRFDRQHAGAPAGRRDRRRPDRDRHGDRVARLLPGAGREVPARATRRSSREHGASAVAQRVDDRGARDRRRVPRARARDPRRARGRGARRARAARRSSCCSRGAA